MATLNSASLLRFVPSSPPLSSASSAFVEIPINGVSSRTKRAYSVSQLVRPNHMAVTVRASVGKGEQPNSRSGDSDGEDEAAADLFRRKLRRSSSVDELAWLLSPIYRKQRYSRVISLYEETRTLGVSPNIFVMMMVIRAYCESGRANDAFELLREMEEGGICKPGLLTYNIVFLGLCKMGRTDDALQLLREMLEGGSCKPDIFTYNTMISGLCEMGRTDDALELLREMEEGRRMQPDVLTYNSMILGLCKMGRTDDALELLRAMEEGESCKPNNATYMTLIMELHKTGNTDAALQLVSKMDGGSRAKLEALMLL